MGEGRAVEVDTITMCIAVIPAARVTRATTTGANALMM